MHEMLLSMDKVTVKLGQRRVLDEVSFAAHQSERILLRGPNGAGKTTLLKTLLGLIAPVSGRVVRKLGAGGSGYVPQLTAGVLRMPLKVCDVVAIGRCSYVKPWKTLSSHDRQAVDDALNATGMAALASRPVRMLSGGEQRRMQLARVLAQEPSVLLLDEPTAYLDADTRREWIDLLYKICHETGLAVILVSHDEQPLFPGFTRTVFLREGRFEV